MVFSNNSDREWRTIGATNPYFGVLSHRKFLNENLNDDLMREFFVSGERDVERVYGVIRAGVQSHFQPARVLDYGCGVGRLVVPFAQRSQTVVGVDVSPGMLEQARENCKRFGVSARLLHVSELDSLAPGSFDLVHSLIVFQHIPVARGEAILRKLIALLDEGGVGAIHLTYSDTHSRFRRGVLALRKRVNLVHNLANLAQHRPFSSPLMQMNCYSMNRIFDILMEGHCSNLHVDFADHNGHHGALLYFQKSLTRLH